MKADCVPCEVRNVAGKNLKIQVYQSSMIFVDFLVYVIETLLDISLNALVEYGKYYISRSAKHMRAHLKALVLCFS